jgi:poly-gamma-glutamate synthesis protein (capsule biosynthesis protein)
MRITFIGDIFPSDESYCLGFGIKSKFENNLCDNWEENIQSATRGSDIVIGNLESPLLDSSFVDRPDFYGNPKFACLLKKCGINVLNVANNHILEHGKIGYEETLKTLADSGVEVVGDKNKILYLQKYNCKIAIAGFCDVDLDIFENDNCFSVLNEQNLEFTLHDMIVNMTDLKIFCFHWGNEYIHKPSMKQRKLASKLIDAGVDVIIGHHPHVIQPYEKYKNGHIFYSLGNFCFDNPFQSRQFSKGMGVVIIFDTIKKNILDVEIFGVKLLQEDLMCRMPSSEFNSYFNRIQKDYHAVKDDKQYDIRYNKELFRRHLTERLLMKLSLLRLYFSINSGDRKLLVKNLKRFYYK